MRPATRPTGCTGSALPIVLLLATLMLWLAVATVRSATIETSLTNSLAEANTAFWLAERGLHAGKAIVLDQPALLPASGPL